MKIALDGMGGDYAPSEVIRGAVEATQEIEDLELIVTGRESEIKQELMKYPGAKRISVLHTEDVITMYDHPAEALRKKKNSSLYKAIELVRDGEAAGIVSAGNSGAQMAISLFVLGRLPGVTRPGIGVCVWMKDSLGLIIDTGANTEITPREYLIFALLGRDYLRTILGREVKIGLLNIGAEPEKGSKLAQQGYAILSENFEEFIGNVEGNEVLSGKADVIVTDGFAGNVLLKSMEGTAERFLEILKDSINKNFKTKMGGLLLSSTLKEAFKKLDYEEYGGSPLLGVNGISIISHGRSRHRAIKNSLKVCYNISKEGVIDRFKEHLSDERFRH